MKVPATSLKSQDGRCVGDGKTGKLSIFGIWPVGEAPAPPKRSAYQGHADQSC